MSEQEQITALAADLDKLIARYCDEFEIAVASAVGVLAIKMHLMIVNATEDD